jgi:hypothetical protein
MDKDCLVALVTADPEAIRATLILFVMAAIAGLLPVAVKTSVLAQYRLTITRR